MACTVLGSRYHGNWVGGAEEAIAYTVFLSSCGLLGVGVACVNTLKMVPF